MKLLSQAFVFLSLAVFVASSPALEGRWSTPTPTKTNHGSVGLVDSKGNFLGLLEFNSTNGKINGIIPGSASKRQAAVQTPLMVTVNTGGAGERNVQSTNTQKSKRIIDAASTFVGAVSGGTKTTNFLAHDSANTAGFALVGETLPGTPGTPALQAREEDASAQYNQSAIWSFTTGFLTGHYRNPDGVKVDTFAAYDAFSNKLFFAGNITLWNEVHHANAIPVSVGVF